MQIIVAMISFFDSNECRARVHCSHCREKEEGRPWRINMGTFYRIDSVDFPCPFGGEWGKVPVDAPKPRKRSKMAGDHLYWLFSRLRITNAAAWLSEKTGVDCGCETRRREINRLGLCKWVWKKWLDTKRIR